MSDTTTQSVQEVFCEVLASLAFMFGDPASPQDLPPMGEPAMMATIGFRGPTAGNLALLAPRSLAQELAANILGIEPDEDAAGEQASDALGELMNVTLGRLLTTISGDAPVFDLTPPQVSDANDEQWQQFVEAGDAVAVLIEDKPVLLRFTLDGQ